MLPHVLSALLAVALAAGSVSSVPSAQQLAEAQRAFEELDFVKVAALPPPADWKRLTRAQFLQLLSLRALALASVKRDEEAGLAFRQLLSLEPSFSLPDQFGPRVRTIMLEQRDAVDRAGPLAVNFDGAAFVVKGSSFGLGEQLAVSWVDAAGPHATNAPLAERVPAPWPPNTSLKAWARVIGPGGCEVLSWKSEQVPFVIEGPVKAVLAVEGEKKTFTGTAIGGFVAGGVAVAALTGGLVALVLADRPRQVLASATRDPSGNILSPTQRDAFALDAEAQTAWQVGGALLITAGLAAAASVTLFFLGPLQVSAGPSAVSVAVPFDAGFSVRGGAP